MVIAVPDQFSALGVQYPVQSAVAVVLQRVAVDRGDLASRIGGDRLRSVLKQTVAADQVLVRVLPEVMHLFSAILERPKQIFGGYREGQTGNEFASLFQSILHHSHHPYRQNSKVLPTVRRHLLFVQLAHQRRFRI